MREPARGRSAAIVGDQKYGSDAQGVQAGAQSRRRVARELALAEKRGILPEARAHAGDSAPGMWFRPDRIGRGARIERRSGARSVSGRPRRARAGH
ncbi:hypothetical protein PT2222_90202 [Paraburkholderia tropica]